MVLPLAISFIPGQGAGLLFINNLGIFLMLFTLGIIILSGSLDLKIILSNLLSPGLIATVLAIIIVLTGLNNFIPKIGFDIFETLGSPTIPIAMIIAGGRIYSLGLNALKFNFWNISLGVLRLIIIPSILLSLSFLLKYLFNLSNDVLTIFMLVNIMPVSINSISMALSYKTSPDLASQGVIFTHIFSIITIPVFIVLMENILLTK
jgi:predicted permease